MQLHSHNKMNLVHTGVHQTTEVIEMITEEELETFVNEMIDEQMRIENNGSNS